MHQVINVGVVEICIKEHYMVVNAIVKTYASNRANNVFIFTTPETMELLIGQGNNQENIQYVILREGEKLNRYFEKINSYPLNRLHYTTVYKYYRHFHQFQPNKDCEIFFHFHNVDKWFKSAWCIQIKRLWKVLFVDSGKVNILYQLKFSLRDLYWDYFRKQLIRKMSKDGTMFIVLSDAQRFHISKYLDVKRTIVFPSLIYEPKYHKDLSGDNKKIRVCIPGLVDQNKKEYSILLDLLERDIDFYSKYYVFDLLGFLPPREKELSNRIKKLIKIGLDILYYEYFIDVEIFDLELYKCDIILSNILMEEKGSIQRKETAAVFHMIRGAKPGIFPTRFLLDDVFKDSVVKFNDYRELHDFFIGLTKNPEELNRLKSLALKASLQNSPSMLIDRIL